MKELGLPPIGGFGMLPPSFPSSTFSNSTPSEVDWEALPEIIRFAHTLSTCSTLSMQEAIAILTPAWESRQERLIASLTQDLDDAQQENEEKDTRLDQLEKKIAEKSSRLDAALVRIRSLEEQLATHTQEEP